MPFRRLHTKGITMVAHCPHQIFRAENAAILRTYKLFYAKYTTFVIKMTSQLKKTFT